MLQSTSVVRLSKNLEATMMPNTDMKLMHEVPLRMAKIKMI